MRRESRFLVMRKQSLVGGIRLGEFYTLTGEPVKVCCPNCGESTDRTQGVDRSGNYCTQHHCRHCAIWSWNGGGRWFRMTEHITVSITMKSTEFRVNEHG